jgi:hypothetical protein
MSRPYDANDCTGATGNWGGHRENPPPYCPKQFQDAKTKRQWVDNVLCHRVSCGEECHHACKSGLLSIKAEEPSESIFIEPGKKTVFYDFPVKLIPRIRVRK